MTLGQRDLALHHALELAAIGEAGQVIGARFVGELARAVERDRDLVRDRGHEEHVRRVEDPIAAGAHRHHADRPPRTRSCARSAFQSSLPTRGPPRLGPADGGRRGLHVRPDLGANSSTWSRRDRPCAAACRTTRSRIQIAPVLERERRERLDQRDLGGLVDVERTAHRGDDRGQAVHLALPGAVLGVDVVEVTARDARSSAARSRSRGGSARAR